MLRYLIFSTFVVSALCGHPLIDQEWEGVIVGGSTAAAGQFPHMASVRTTGNAYICGGFIINNRWIGSVAHCTSGRTSVNTNTVVGTNSRSIGGVTFTSARVVNHPSYNSNTLANDISMIQTVATITFTNLIQAITLGVDHVGGGVTATASGWGALTRNAENLQFLTVQTLTNADCRSRHSDTNAARVHDNTICTFLRAGTGMCFGDSGSPLITANTVIGAVSWGVACAQGFPDVFARISSHRTWMISQM